MVAGIVTLLPVIYVRSLAENVFYQAPIIWEWGLVLGACVIFIVCSEAYKAWMRPHIVRLVKKEGGEREKEWNIFFEGGICTLITTYTDFALYLILSSSFNVGPNCGPLSARRQERIRVVDLAGVELVVVS